MSGFSGLPSFQGFGNFGPPNKGDAVTKFPGILFEYV